MKTSSTGTSGGTVLDSVIISLRRAAEYNRNDQNPPAVVLWTDKEGLIEK
jgi:hypothetical protein